MEYFADWDGEQLEDDTLEEGLTVTGSNSKIEFLGSAPEQHRDTITATPFGPTFDDYRSMVEFDPFCCDFGGRDARHSDVPAHAMVLMNDDPVPWPEYLRLSQGTLLVGGRKINDTEIRLRDSGGKQHERAAE